jgi:hypothetical protein
MMHVFQFILDEWLYIHYLQLKDANTNSTPETLLGKEIKTIETVDDVFASSSSKKITDKIELMRLSNSMEKQEQDDSSDRKPLEKELCLKGIEMFGKNRYQYLLIFTLHLVVLVTD